MRRLGAARELLAVFKASLEFPPPAHAEVRQLVHHSRLVRFVVELRGPFLRAFEKYRHDFPASYSAEAYFLGTVLHSLDHLNYTRFLDPWALTAMPVAPRLQTLHAIQCIVRFALSEDLPCVLFARDFKTSPMAFHQEVYQKASKIDPDLAARMQTCIIK